MKGVNKIDEIWEMHINIETSKIIVMNGGRTLSPYPYEHIGQLMLIDKLYTVRYSFETRIIEQDGVWHYLIAEKMNDEVDNLIDELNRREK